MVLDLNIETKQSNLTRIETAGDFENIVFNLSSKGSWATYRLVPSIGPKMSIRNMTPYDLFWNC